MKIKLWENVPEVDGVKVTGLPEFTYYPAVTKNMQRGAVVVLPGGGYSGHAEHEGHSIAGWLNGQGIHAYVLKYRVSPHRHPAPLADAQRAIRLARQLSAEHGHKNKIGILGFSAGGHLTATAVTMFNYKAYEKIDAIDELSARPDAGILCYAVLRSDEYIHQGSYNNLLGAEHTQVQKEEVDPEKRVTIDTPPCFLWHTAEDQSVKVQNSLMFAKRLADCNVPFELHVYPEGPHGIGGHNFDYYETCRDWLQACEKWLFKQGF